MPTSESNIFHFRCANGDVVTVPAPDELSARSIAMEQRWGPPSGMYAPCYYGRGLHLVDERGMPIIEPTHA